MIFLQRLPIRNIVMCSQYAYKHSCILNVKIIRTDPISADGFVCFQAFTFPVVRRVFRPEDFLTDTLFLVVLFSVFVFVDLEE
jgi:hypothetical protein